MKTKAKIENLSNSKIEQVVRGMKKDFNHSLENLLKTLNVSVPNNIYSSTRKTRKTKKDRLAIRKPLALETKLSKPKKSVYDMFLEALKAIGRPAMTREIASRYRKIHAGAELPKSKKDLMQQLYNSASYLAKEGQIARHPVGKRSYEYSLK